MKHTRHGRLFRSFSAAAMLCIALLAGCVHNSADKAKYAAVSGNLETGGTLYGICTSSASWSELYRRYVLRLEQALVTSKLDDAQRTAIREKLFAIEYWNSLAGLDKAAGAGWSSVRAKDGIFSNRFFLALDKDETIPLDALTGCRTVPLSSLAETLPRETFLAAGIRFSMTETLKLLQNSGEAGEFLFSVLPPGFPVDILVGLDGWLIFAAARKTGLTPAENRLMIRIPDPDGKLFSLLRYASGAKTGKAVENDRVKLPFGPAGSAWQNTIFVRSGGNLNLFNSEDAEELFTKKSEGSLKENETFCRYSSGIPLEDASAFMFSRKLASGYGNCSVMFSAGGVVLPLESRSRFGVMTRKSDGWLWQEKGDIDLSGNLAEVLLSLSLADHILPPPVKKAAKNAPAAKIKKNEHLCSVKLKDLHNRLLKFAEKNGGIFPEFTGRNTLEQLFEKGAVPHNIFYFGGRKGEANFPLAVSLHDAKASGFCVLYADGKISSYKLERAGSCRRVISFLYTLHRWEAKLFQHLIKQAEILDEPSAKKE